MCGESCGAGGIRGSPNTLAGAGTGSRGAPKNQPACPRGAVAVGTGSPELALLSGAPRRDGNASKKPLEALACAHPTRTGSTARPGAVQVPRPGTGRHGAVTPSSSRVLWDVGSRLGGSAGAPRGFGDSCGAAPRGRAAGAPGAAPSRALRVAMVTCEWPFPRSAVCWVFLLFFEFLALKWSFSKGTAEPWPFPMRGAAGEQRGWGAGCPWWQKALPVGDFGLYF